MRRIKKEKRIWILKTCEVTHPCVVWRLAWSLSGRHRSPLCGVVWSQVTYLLDSFILHSLTFRAVTCAIVEWEASHALPLGDLPTFTPAQPCPPLLNSMWQREKSNSLSAVRYLDWKRFLKFSLTRKTFGSYLICLDQRDSCKSDFIADGVKKKKNLVWTFKSVKKIIMNLSHGIYHALTVCRKSEGAPSI
jgi:hypothetical protein